jgi:lysophospholipase L1-like esterase
MILISVDYMVTRILCFGDSNTRGYIPGTDHERFPANVRFPKVLQKLTGKNFEIIEDGQDSRTIMHEDTRPGKEGRVGSVQIVPCLDSNAPLNVVILMLGTGELKHKFQNTPEQVGALLEKHFVKVILKRGIKLVIVSPPVLNEKTAYSKQRYVGGTEKSKQLSNVYSKIAKDNKCDFVDASKLKVGSDGVHMTKASQIKLAEMLVSKIKQMKF